MKRIGLHEVGVASLTASEAGEDLAECVIGKIENDLGEKEVARCSEVILATADELVNYVDVNYREAARDNPNAMLKLVTTKLNITELIELTERLNDFVRCRGYTTEDRKMIEEQASMLAEYDKRLVALEKDQACPKSLTPPDC